jgi:hypothetical protein
VTALADLQRIDRHAAVPTISHKSCAYVIIHLGKKRLPAGAFAGFLRPRFCIDCKLKTGGSSSPGIRRIL